MGFFLIIIIIYFFMKHTNRTVRRYDGELVIRQMRLGEITGMRLLMGLKTYKYFRCFLT